MRSHDQFQEDLPAYAARRLKGEELRLFEEHLRACDECRRMASAWSEMAAVLRDAGDVLFDPHPSESELRQIAVGGAEAASEGMLRHLEVCASCKLETRIWDRHDAVAGTRAATARRRPMFAVASLSAAAGLLLGLGLAMLWRSSDGSPSTRSVESSSWAGPTVQILLPRPLRGQSPPAASHRIEKDERRVVIAFPLQESQVKEGDGPYLFEIAGAVGPVLSRFMTGSAVLRHIQTSTVVTIDLPADLLPSGRYECRVVDPGGAVLYRTSIEVVPTD